MSEDGLLKEYYVKNICSRFYPKRYVDLIKSEKPDFKNSDIGLEICEGIKTSIGQVRSFYHKNVKKDYLEIKQSAQKIGFSDLQQSDNEKMYLQRNENNDTLHYILLNGKKILCALIEGNSSCDNCASFRDALSSHLVKLQNYQPLKSYDLAIYIEETLDYVRCRADIMMSVVEDSVKTIKKLYLKSMCVRKFENIILVYLTHIILIKTKNWKYAIKEIDDRIRKECFKKAKTLK